MHFQIDRETAPWHPYWPFTSSEATKAGYSFFEAINNGLNQAKAEKYTVNPMAWVQANLNYNSSSSDSSEPVKEENTENEVEAKLAQFKISADKTTAYTEEEIKITVIALDQNSKTLEDYTPGQDFKISANSGSSRYVRTLKFTEGKANLTLTDIKAKTVVLTITDGKIQDSIELSFEEAPEVAPDQFNILVSRLNLEIGDKIGVVVEALNGGQKIQNYTPSADFSFTINNTEIPLKFKNGVGELTFIADKLGAIPIQVRENEAHEKIELTVTEKTGGNNTTTAEVPTENTTENEETTVEIVEEESTYTLKIVGENIGLTNSPMTFVVKAFDENDNLIKDFEPSETISVTSDGKGVLQPEKLQAKNFVNGLATVNYLTSEEEDVTIQVGEASIEVTFISEVKQISAFSVEHDGSFIPKVPEVITIQALDENGAKTPDFISVGKVKFTLIDGAGTFNPTELTGNDFKNGKAEVIFTATDNGDVKIKAQNGAIVGISRYLKADEKGVFADVDSKHEFAEAITYLKEKGIITGYDDGTFKPEQSVSRVEALKMIIAGIGIQVADGSVDFPDTESPSWYSPYISTGLAENIVAGYPDGSFKPTNNIIRAEYLKILLEASKVKLAENVVNKPYYDVAITEWYAKYASFSKANKLFEVSNNLLLPSQNVTR